MGIFKKQRIRKDIDLIIEEKFYEHVANEIAAGEIRQGLWAKATAEADTSSEADIHKKYLKLRVEHLLAEGRLHEQFLEEVLEAEDEEELVAPKTFGGCSEAIIIIIGGLLILAIFLIWVNF